MTPELINAIAALVGAIVWPSIALYVLIMYRKSVAVFLENLDSLTLPGGFEAKLRKAIDEGTSIESNAEREVTFQQLDAAERVDQLATPNNNPAIRQKMIEFAREYERIRKVMPRGDTRTEKMEHIVAKMRTLALATRPYLSELVRSESPGERLAAIAILQMESDSSYLEWLGQRFREEKPFVAYHAALALRTAARAADRNNREDVERAIKAAMDTLGQDSQSTDRWRALSKAQQELQENTT